MKTREQYCLARILTKVIVNNIAKTEVACCRADDMLVARAFLNALERSPGARFTLRHTGFCVQGRKPSRVSCVTLSPADFG